MNKKNSSLKIAISGKGGVGKTTLSALLAGSMAMSGRSVIAVDADPDANLASALGISSDEPLIPIGEMRELIAERTGAKNNYGGYFKLNPRVDDIPEKFAQRIDNIRLLVLGGIRKGGGGCICPATALLKALLTHLVIFDGQLLIMDMEAGIEHLGRATAQSMDALIVVVDGGPWSVQCAHRVRNLASDIGMKNILVVANQVTDPAELDRLKEDLKPLPLIGHLPFDPRLRKNFIGLDESGKLAVGEVLADSRSYIDQIMSNLESRLH